MSSYRDRQSFQPGDDAQYRSYTSGRERREAIKSEIQRFESVHPCIYAIYDLLDLLADQPLIAQQIRDHVVCIEDSFVNSQEWTMSRTVPDLKLGVIGALPSGKTALVHRYLTGSYMQDESPEGGRFKKELVLDGHSFLLLIRDEGGAPSQQFCEWVDAVILVFSLECEASFDKILSYYQRLAHFRSPLNVPLILVGTQDAISESRPRVIDDARARDLAARLGPRPAAYFETCATYGLNVDKVFREACNKILLNTPAAAKGASPPPVPPPAGSCPSTPSHQHYGGLRNGRSDYDSVSRGSSVLVPVGTPTPPTMASVFAVPSVPSPISPSPSAHSVHHSASTSSATSAQHHYFGGLPGSTQLKMRENERRLAASGATDSRLLGHGDSENQLPTPSSTPNATRKAAHSTSRRISNIFRAPKDVESAGERVRNGFSMAETLGSGRAIPIKQGLLYKRATKSLNSKEWKKKYFCLHSDGRLVYHTSLKDYMEDHQGKEIFLGLATVKVPGAVSKAARRQPITAPRHHTQPILAAATAPLGASNGVAETRRGRGKSDPFGKARDVTLTNYEAIPEAARLSAADANSLQYPSAGEADSGTSGGGGAARAETTPNVKKKRHARKGSGAKGSDDGEDGEACEFIVVSSDEKQWQLEAESTSERDDWVTAIQEQIGKSLQGQLSKKAESGRVIGSEAAGLRVVAGNDRCADCGAASPAWASLNLGAVVCIGCSGIHRQLSSSVSRVRSLDLDDWPAEFVRVMRALGNRAVNELWEAEAEERLRPGPDSPQEEKEAWIRRKYIRAEFKRPLTFPLAAKSLHAQLVDAVLQNNLLELISILAEAARMGEQQAVNEVLSVRDRRTPLHLACSVGSPEILQMLIWHNADALAVDGEGRSGLWYAEQSESSGGLCAKILREAGCSPQGSSRPPRRAAPKFPCDE